MPGRSVQRSMSKRSSDMPLTRFELLAAGEFWLSRTPDEPSNDWGVSYPLGATWVKLQDATTGFPLLHLNTHLEDGDEGELSRVEGSKLIVERISQLQASSIPVLVTGDFNSAAWKTGDAD